MTEPPDVAPLAVADAEAAVRELRSAGLRISTARRLVIDELFRIDGPASAAHLSHALSLDESSVYRNLELLERHGLVRHLHLGHSPGLYTLAGRGSSEYLYCERCGKVTVLDAGELESIRAEIHERFGHMPRFTHFALVGICDGCAARDLNERSDAPTTLHSHGGFVHAHPHRGVHTHPE